MNIVLITGTIYLTYITYKKLFTTPEKTPPPTKIHPHDGFILLNDSINFDQTYHDSDDHCNFDNLSSIEEMTQEQSSPFY